MDPASQLKGLREESARYRGDLGQSGEAKAGYLNMVVCRMCSGTSRVQAVSECVYMRWFIAVRNWTIRDSEIGNITPCSQPPQRSPISPHSIVILPRIPYYQHARPRPTSKRKTKVSQRSWVA
ncbi:hypothetical protein B0H34DRAFT_518689 [Crassisporium funariophilum]|nr:hypothetical protein B0H34DRAFT_518689 [Crassisporium funariophilum]